MQSVASARESRISKKGRRGADHTAARLYLWLNENLQEKMDASVWLTHYMNFLSVKQVVLQWTSRSYLVIGPVWFGMSAYITNYFENFLIFEACQQFVSTHLSSHHSPRIWLCKFKALNYHCSFCSFILSLLVFHSKGNIQKARIFLTWPRDHPASYSVVFFYFSLIFGLLKNSKVTFMEKNEYPHSICKGHF